LLLTVKGAKSAKDIKAWLPGGTGGATAFADKLAKPYRNPPQQQMPTGICSLAHSRARDVFHLGHNRHIAIVPFAVKQGSPRQACHTHQVLVDCARALASFTDRPYHQRLAATHVAGGEHTVDRSPVGICTRSRALDVAARIQRYAQVRQHALVDRVHEAHRQGNQIGT
jgi:hypothetical protein